MHSIPYDDDDQHHRLGSPAPKPQVTPKAPSAARERSFGFVSPPTPWQALPPDESNGIGSGLLREKVNRAIRFHQPPDCGESYLLQWREFKDERRYVLPLDEESYRQLVSLAEWRKSLAESPPDSNSTADGNARDALNAFANSLLNLLDQLHQCRWRIGLVHPENLFVIRQKKTRMLLPDLAFSWEAEGTPPWEDSFDKPGWLNPKLPRAALWPMDPACQQLAYPEGWPRCPAFAEGDGDSGAEPFVAVRKADLQLAARLFAFLLSGQSGPVKVLPGQSTVWNVLQNAELGRYQTASEFRTALKETPLSYHFLTPVAPKVADVGTAGTAVKTRSRTPLLVALLLLVGLAGLGLWFFRDELFPSKDDNRVVVNPVDPPTKVVPKEPPSPPIVSGPIGPIEVLPPPREQPSASFAALVEKFKNAKNFDDKHTALQEMTAVPNRSDVDESWRKYCRNWLRRQWVSEFNTNWTNGRTEESNPLKIQKEWKRLDNEIGRILSIPGPEKDQTEERKWRSFLAQFVQ